jgi:hypothetical protein
MERSGDDPHTHNPAILLNAGPSSLAAFQPTLPSQSFCHTPRLTQGEFCPLEHRANLRSEGSSPLPAVPLCARDTDGLAPFDSRLDVSLQSDAWGASTSLTDLRNDSSRMTPRKRGHSPVWQNFNQYKSRMQLGYKPES